MDYHSLPRLPFNEPSTRFATFSTQFIMPKTPLKAGNTGLGKTSITRRQTSIGLGQTSISRGKTNTNGLFWGIPPVMPKPRCLFGRWIVVQLASNPQQINRPQ